jgi:hypothetical protein
MIVGPSAGAGLGRGTRAWSRVNTFCQMRRRDRSQPLHQRMRYGPLGVNL